VLEHMALFRAWARGIERERERERESACVFVCVLMCVEPVHCQAVIHKINNK
jgi:hypothetical protein